MMTNCQEFALTFKVGGHNRLAIVHPGEITNNTGVLVVVGGPQYRVGSHRQFVQLSRYLAQVGISSMRFDCQGMGDSEGCKVPFDQIDGDIAGAINAFQLSQPQIKKIIIWGLCDAASAALIYSHQDDRVTGLVMLNPWLRSEKAMGKTMVKYYYLQRLFTKNFWKKLFTGKINVVASAKDAKGFVRDSITNEEQALSGYQRRMLLGLQKFHGKLCLILSGADLTAREFDEQTHNNKAWQKLRNKGNEIHRIAEADHTFSASEFKQKVEQITYNFIQNTQ